MDSDCPCNWDLPNRELARIWRVSTDTVQRRRVEADNAVPRWAWCTKRVREDPEYRKAVAEEQAKAREMELVDRRRAPQGRRDWSGTDWSLSNSEIGRRLGLSHEAVRQARERYQGGPKAPTNPQRFRDYVATHKPALDGLTVAEAIAASEVAVVASTAGNVLRAAGVEVARAPLWGRLARADWRLPISDLARIWGKRPTYVANYRAARAMPQARWDLRHPPTRDDREYLEALRAEEARAGLAK